ncbi:hypothetical protein P691DRAFT_769414 [Macrolepiota fuliginosa MF-IS2]|uniref:Uncharacterized protein n=1 Tax=Macrolepiota fuliginosa MF-IS2 TaxID=1400762 RepID=A0A9P5WVS5_9AGAR|nr:hypothetical protein P691DRAFT_769414 [Macrolepiota fuliginosa MF-IS2]
MPRKAKDKPVTNASPPFKLSATTEQFLATMDQNHCIASKFTTSKLMSIGGSNWETIFNDLSKMHFVKVNETPAIPSSTPIEVDDDEPLEYDDLSLAEDLTNAIAAFGQWFESNNIPDDQCPSPTENIRHLTMMFSLIPAPHCCLLPLPCTHLHQTNALPCAHPHAGDVPPPPPCQCPHCDDKDTPMEPLTPTHAFSEAALQTPAPSHKASTSPPPPTAAATLPAAAASIPPTSPHGHASYASTVAKNLNPAAPPFMHGPPCAPAV